VAALAEHMSRSEPDPPSISAPVKPKPDRIVQPQLFEPPNISESEHPTSESASTGMKHQHPAKYLTAALGHRPDTPGPTRDSWDHAAAAIEKYRTRYEITSPTALGPEPDAGVFRQRLDRNQAAAQILQSVEHPECPAGRDTNLERITRDKPELASLEPGRQESIGWECFSDGGACDGR